MHMVELVGKIASLCYMSYFGNLGEIIAWLENWVTWGNYKGDIGNFVLEVNLRFGNLDIEIDIYYSGYETWRIL